MGLPQTTFAASSNKVTLQYSAQYATLWDMRIIYSFV